MTRTIGDLLLNNVLSNCELSGWTDLYACCSCEGSAGVIGVLAFYVVLLRV